MGFREKILIFGVLPWLVALVIIVLLTVPTIGGIFDKLNDLNTKQDELQTLKSQVKQKSNTTKIKSDITDVKQSLKGFNLQFPQEDTMDTLYVDIESAAKESKVSVYKISVAKEKKFKFPKDFFSKDNDKKKDKKGKKDKKKSKKEADPFIVYSRNIKLEIIGSYQAIVDMAYYLSNYYRFIGFSDLQIKIITKNNDLPSLSSSEKSLDAIITFEIYKISKQIPAEETDKDKDKDKNKDQDKDKSKKSD